MKISASPPNAIIFILDPTNKSISVPYYNAGELIAASDSCISVGIQPDVDGDTEISLYGDKIIHSDLTLAFSGSIFTPGKEISVVTAQFHRLLSIDIVGTESKVYIFVDNLINPSRVEIFTASDSNGIENMAK